MKQGAASAALWLTGALLGLSGCAKRESEPAAQPASIAFHFTTAHAPSESSPGARPLRLAGHGDGAAVTLGHDTLFLRRVAIVFQDIRIVPADAGDCDANPDEEEVACPDLQVGPALLDLPLGDRPESTFTVPVPADTYTFVQLRIYAADPQRDGAFISTHPTFAGRSILVQGTLSRAGQRRDFTYTTTFSEREALEFAAPLKLPAQGTARLTLHVDLATWFLAADKATLIDPATAGPGGPNDHLVHDNIRLSLGVLQGER